MTIARNLGAFAANVSSSGAYTSNVANTQISGLITSGQIASLDTSKLSGAGQWVLLSSSQIANTAAVSISQVSVNYNDYSEIRCVFSLSSGFNGQYLYGSVWSVAGGSFEYFTQAYTGTRYDPGNSNNNQAWNGGYYGTTTNITTYTNSTATNFPKWTGYLAFDLNKKTTALNYPISMHYNTTTAMPTGLTSTNTIGYLNGRGHLYQVGYFTTDSTIWLNLSSGSSFFGSIEWWGLKRV